MITEKELKEEIKATKRFIKYIEKKKSEHLFDEIYGYLDGLQYALKGKLD